MTRQGFPIEEYPLKDSVRTGIVYEGLAFPLWEAAVAAGATLEELARLERGEYPLRFSARLLAWHRLHQAVALHRADAAERAAERKAKKRSRK